MNLDHESARKFAEHAARSVGSFAREGFGCAAITHEKSEHPSDVVTRYDTETEKRLSEILGAFDAGIGFYGEESGRDGSTDTYWLVDPIDGTGHYARGNPFCTTMIALIDGGRSVASVIYDFNAELMFSAALGNGATCNGERIQVSDRDLSSAYLCVEINLSVPGNSEFLARLQRTTPPVNQVNCGWDFSRTAMGRLDGRLMKDPWAALWDVAPGALLVAEAGGVVVNLGKTTYDLADRNFMAVAPRVFEGLTGGPDPLVPMVD